MRSIRDSVPTETVAPDEVLGRLFAHRCVLPASDPGEVIAKLPRSGAVIALTSDDGVLVQLLTTSNLRRAVTQRLTAPADTASTRRASLAGVVRTVWWQPAYSQFESGLLYLERARQLLGSTYRKSLAFALPAYACIDLGEPHPRWTASETIGPAGAVTCGPFDTRKRCTRFIGELEDLFDLCRYHQELVQAPRGRRCEYYDMGKCPAPCDGTVSLDRYQAMLADSVRFAQGDARELFARLEADMARAAGALAFERAQRCRDALARARAVQAMEGRWAGCVDGFRCLILQRGPRRGTLRTFFCDAGAIERGDDVRVAEIDSAAQAWSAHTWASDKHGRIDATFRGERIALVCHHLGKGERAAGFYQIATERLDPVTLARAVHARFSRA